MSPQRNKSQAQRWLVHMWPILKVCIAQAVFMYHDQCTHSKDIHNDQHIHHDQDTQSTINIHGTNPFIGQKTYKRSLKCNENFAARTVYFTE